MKLDELDCNIVMLEDDEMTLDVYQQILSNSIKTATIKGFDSISDDFFDYIKTYHIDLFIMDIVLGEYSGIDLTSKLLKMMKGLTFLFVSGFNYTYDSFKQFEGKCLYDFISKPVSHNELLIRYNALINISKSYNKIIDNSRSSIIGGSVDDLRDEYFKRIEEDRLMINKFRKDLRLN